MVGVTTSNDKIQLNAGVYSNLNVAEKVGQSLTVGNRSDYVIVTL